MKALALNTEDPVFSTQVTRDVVNEVSIGALESRKAKEKALKEFRGIRDLFYYISSALEKVEMQYIELEARPSPLAFSLLAA